MVVMWLLSITLLCGALGWSVVCECDISLVIFTYIDVHIQQIAFSHDRAAGCFVLVVFWTSCGSYRSLTLPRGVVSWPAVCYCGISYCLAFIHMHAVHAIPLIFLKG